MNPLRSLSRLGWALALIVALGLIILGGSYCSERKRASEAKGNTMLAEGRTSSAVEAINEIGELGQRADATDAQVKEAQDALRQADPADRDRVFRHRVCVMQHRPDCDRLLGTGAAGADNADAPR